ncbi:transposase [Lichenicola cladoniae]
MEVIVRGERRRNWTTEQKCQIVAESLQPGLTPSDVARRHGIGTGLLYTWRRQMLTGATGTLTGVGPWTGRLTRLSWPDRGLGCPSSTTRPTATTFRRPVAGS